MVLKRGVFFTVTSILFIAVLVLLFTSGKRASTIDTGSILVESADQVRGQLENKTLPLLLRQYSYQTMYDLAVDSQNRGVYSITLPADFTSAMMTGSYSLGPLPGYKTPQQALDEVSDIALSIGYTASFDLVSITVSQTGAFQAGFSAVIDYNLSTLDNTVIYRRSIIVQDVFSLEGIPDLYYNNMQRNRLWNDRRLIKQYTTQNWDGTKVNLFALSRQYYPNTDGPSVFNRLQGLSGASPFGIETLINMSATPTGDLTSIDWQYFTNLGFSCTYSNAAVYPSLRLSFASMGYYNITTGTNVYNPAGTCPTIP